MSIVTQNEKNIEKFTDTVNNLQIDMAHVSRVVGKLDLTIEKLTEVSSAVSQLLGIQGSRLELHVKNSDDMSKLMEERRKDTEKNTKEIYKKIESLEDSIYKDMESDKKEILSAINDLKNSIDLKADKTDKRITALEVWRWILLGGGVVLIYIAEHASIVASFFT